jgi:hypothetical protein
MPRDVFVRAHYRRYPQRRSNCCCCPVMLFLLMIPPTALVTVFVLSLV